MSVSLSLASNVTIKKDESKRGKLITALRTAVENGEGTLGKEATSHHDSVDAFMVSLNVLALTNSRHCRC